MPEPTSWTHGHGAFSVVLLFSSLQAAVEETQRRIGVSCLISLLPPSPVCRLVLLGSLVLLLVTWSQGMLQGPGRKGVQGPWEHSLSPAETGLFPAETSWELFFLKFWHTIYFYCLSLPIYYTSMPLLPFSINNVKWQKIFGWYKWMKQVREPGSLTFPDFPDFPQLRIGSKRTRVKVPAWPPRSWLPGWVETLGQVELYF